MRSTLAANAGAQRYKIAPILKIWYYIKDYLYLFGGENV